MGEVYVFRPGNVEVSGQVLVRETSESPTVRGGERWLRYAGGLWLPDDGEYDLAFVSVEHPIALGVSQPVWDGVEWVWRHHASACAAAGVESGLVDPWHWQVRNPADGRGNNVGGFDRTDPNHLAGHAASEKCCQLHGCSNGRGPRFDVSDEWMMAGLVRTLAGETVRPPESPVCYLCANDGAGHKLLYLKAERERLQSDLEYAKERSDKLELDLADERDHAERLTGRLAAFEALMGSKQPVGA